MIPQRIRMSGFLSYKDEQDIDFGSAALWMLAGTNGSGKSSVFDGVTYALFGSHRGGNQNAGELINKECVNANVEFEFRLDHVVYRLKRTIRRSTKGAVSGTQQVFRERAAGQWEAVGDTTKKVDFDAWVHDKIGLNYETFTSSVLLLQGKAEKLLDAKPNGRAEVLASIVDLERYQRLHAKANERKLEYKSRLDAISYQTEAVPDVPDMEYMAALLQIEACESDRDEVRARIEGLHGREALARRWLEAQNRLAAVQSRFAAAEALLGDAVKIEKSHRRLQELRGVLPAVNVVVTMRMKTKDSQAKTNHYLEQREATQARVREADAALAQATKQRQDLQKQQAGDDAKLAQVNARLREVTGLLEKVRQVEEAQAEARRHEDELKRLPATPEKDQAAAQAEYDRLTELERVLPTLERFSTDRHDLAVAIQDEARHKATLTELKAVGVKLGETAAAVAAELQAARRTKAEAEQAVGAARGLAEQARRAADEFATLAGEKACRACGQPLTARHFAQEKSARETQAANAEKSLRDAKAALAEVTAREQGLSKRDAESQAELRELRDKYVEASGLVKQAAANTKRLTGTVSVQYAEMPPLYKQRVATEAPADWSSTSYPERDELMRMRREAAGVAGAKKALQAARDALTRFGQVRFQIEATEAALKKLQAGLAGVEPLKVRGEHQTLHAEEKSLVNALKAYKASLMDVESRADRLKAESHAAVNALTDLSGKLQNEENNRRNAAENAARAQRELPPEWVALVAGAGLAEDSSWKAEAERLTADGVEARYQGLAQARAGLDALREAIGGQQAEVDAVPPEARQSPEEVRAAIAVAKADQAAKEETLLAGLQNKAKLDGYRERRDELGKEYRQLDGTYAQYKALAELLGRDRLQRYLVRQAERQIVDTANGVLDRLSGGQLFLKLVAGEEATSTEKALDLEAYNRVTGGAPINVAFLSGSQKFRVAVCLALAIGQYASKQHRPIESVIIDEGFGCLDRQGRQVMIQELQNLRGHLHCILLVSHQEEFADAFPDGYRFELQDGATKVSRFQR